RRILLRSACSPSPPLALAVRGRDSEYTGRRGAACLAPALSCFRSCCKTRSSAPDALSGAPRVPWGTLFHPQSLTSCTQGARSQPLLHVREIRPLPLGDLECFRSPRLPLA